MITINNCFLRKVPKNIGNFINQNNSFDISFEKLSNIDRCKAIKAELAKRYFYLNALRGYKSISEPVNLLACKYDNEANIEPLWGGLTRSDLYGEVYKLPINSYPGHIQEYDYNFFKFEESDNGNQSLNLRLVWRIGIYNNRFYNKGYLQMGLTSKKTIGEAKSLNDILKFSQIYIELYGYDKDSSLPLITNVEMELFALDPDVWDLGNGHIDKTLNVKNAVYVEKMTRFNNYNNISELFDIDLRFDYRKN